MQSFAVMAVQVVAAVGFGSAVLRLLGVSHELDLREQVAFGFAIGCGVIGWIIFPMGAGGLLAAPWLWAALLVGCLGLVTLRGESGSPPPSAPLGLVVYVLVALVAVLFIFDIFEGLSPPLDADSLAYHFALPKQFIQLGRIEFVPRAIDGAVPMLVEMTYLPVLALGGERALTLWTMVSGWAAAGLLFVLCRRFLSLVWSLAVVLVLISTPAVVFGAGSGQVEVRLALFVMVGAWALARSRETGQLNYAALAGIAAGLFAGGKYFGLVFMAAGGLILLFQRRWLLCGATYAAVGVAVGSPWYLWNWLHTGDPVFPMLFHTLGDPATGLWNDSQQRMFTLSYLASEVGIRPDLLNLLVYPFLATFAPLSQFDAGRVGLGPFPLLALPFAALAALRQRGFMPKAVNVYGVLAGLFYVLWFLLGSSQRVRHLVPVLPLVLLWLSVAASRLDTKPLVAWPLVAAFVLTLTIQTAGKAVFAAQYVRHIISGETREAFLAHRVDYWAAVAWINGRITSNERILIEARQVAYLIDAPAFVGPRIYQIVVDLDPTAPDLPRLMAQLAARKITHIMTIDGATAGSESPILVGPYAQMLANGCVDVAARIPTVARISRTVSMGESKVTIIVLRVDYRNCRS